MSIWSTRQALERAATLQAGRSAEVIATLDEMADAFGITSAMADAHVTGRCLEHQAAVTRLAELHELVDHLVANLKGGHGVPATPPTTAGARKGMPPVTHLKKPASTAPQKPHPGVMRPPDFTGPRGTRAPRTAESIALTKATLRKKAEARAQRGLASAREAATLTGYTLSGWYSAMAAGRVPKPHSGKGRSAIWQRADLVDVRPRVRGATA